MIFGVEALGLCCGQEAGRLRRNLGFIGRSMIVVAITNYVQHRFAVAAAGAATTDAKPTNPRTEYVTKRYVTATLK
jgi:hypothetical protein